MPFTLSLSDWYLAPAHPGDVLVIQVYLAANLSMRRGTILGELAGSYATYAPYGASHMDGTQMARLILQVDCSTDANGKITLYSGTVDTGFAADRKYDKVNAYVSGSFACEDLFGLDATAVGQLGRLISGTVNRGILRVQ